MPLVLIVYFVAANAVGFALMGVDKERARKDAWRIPEKTLFAAALLGGALGATAGMFVFRHKTKHWYFRYGLPVIAAAWVVLFVCLMVAGVIS